MFAQARAAGELGGRAHDSRPHFSIQEILPARGEAAASQAQTTHLNSPVSCTHAIEFYPNSFLGLHSHSPRAPASQPRPYARVEGELGLTLHEEDLGGYAPAGSFHADARLGGRRRADHARRASEPRHR